MRVLQLISSTGFYGAEHAMLTLSQGLASDGYIPYIGIIEDSSNSSSNSALKQKAKESGLEVLSFPCRGRFDFSTILSIRRFVKANKIKIIHSHGYKSNFYGFFSSLGLNTAKIATCHNWLSRNIKMRIYEKIDKLLLRRFTSVVTVSNILKQEIINSRISALGVSVIYNGIDPDCFEINHVQKQSEISDLRQEFSLREDELVIGTIGRLSREKGHLYLLEAFKQVLSAYPNTKLFIVGEGELRRDLELTVRSLVLERNVIFTGMRSDIPRMLGLFDIFVLPSLEEAMPLSLLEAMAAKKPIVATDVGDIARVIDRDNGLLIKPKDAKALSEAVIQLVNHKDRARSLASRACERVRGGFSARKMVEEYIRIYNSFKINNGGRLSEKRRVIQVEIAGKGGICHYTYNLAQRLSNLLEVSLVTSIDYELKNSQRNFELIGLFNRFKTNPLFIFRLIKIFRHQKVSIIQFQLSQYPLFILLLCYLAKVFSDKRIVITAHNLSSHEKKRGDYYLYRRLYSLADRVVVHAQANREELRSKYLIPARKISVIPHGNYLFFNDNNGNFVRPQNSFNILFFGYIRKYKGLGYLIRAFKSIKERMPQARLHIVGKAIEDFKDYRRQINELGLKKNIELNLNYINFTQVKDYFHKANVVVLPYLSVYQSGILQLAYGFGRPVVATNVGGLGEAIEEGQSGFIVPAKNVDALADRITRVLADYPLQERMGRYALDLAKSKFSWDNIAEETAKLYRSM
ncbi:MAG: glycosyltransferase [Candidatus Omnitrophota bacterium]